MGDGKIYSLGAASSHEESRDEFQRHKHNLLKILLHAVFRGSVSSRRSSAIVEISSGNCLKQAIVSQRILAIVLLSVSLTGMFCDRVGWRRAYGTPIP